MATRGYILNGVYHKAEAAPISKMVKPRQTMYKQGDHARQRFDHSAEILQPHTPDGKPNPHFIEAHPDAAAEYGFLPKTGPDPELESRRPAEGSLPWGQVRP